MGAIVGAFNDNQSRSQVERMLKWMEYRGSHGVGIEVCDDSALGCAIMDLQDDTQASRPAITNYPKRFAVADASIYNRSLLAALAQSGAGLTNSDLILSCYDHIGTNIVSHIDGDFAFIITGDDDLFVARDTLGVKPLYFLLDHNKMYFASERSALGGWHKEVKEFPAGHYFHAKTGFVEYFPMGWFDLQPLDSPEHNEMICEALEHAVIKRVTPDCCLVLTGGLTNCIIAELARQMTSDVQSITIGIGDHPTMSFTRDIARRVGLIHHERIVSQHEVSDAIDWAICRLESCDVRSVKTTVVHDLICRTVSGNARILLTDEGSHEVESINRYLYLSSSMHATDRIKQAVRYLRSNQSVCCESVAAAYGMECRLPVLDHELIRCLLAFASPPTINELFLSKNRYIENAGGSEIGSEQWLDQLLLAIADDEVSDEDLNLEHTRMAATSTQLKLSALFRKRFVALFGEDSFTSS